MKMIFNAATEMVYSLDSRDVRERLKSNAAFKILASNKNLDEAIVEAFATLKERTRVIEDNFIPTP